MEKFIYLQRHGESETNINKIFTCRKIDPSLSIKGREQIVNKIKYYEDKNINKIISSPSKRTIETATILSKGLNMNYSIDENLYEIDVGKLEGRSEFNEKNKICFNETINNWIYNDKNISFPDGEDYIKVKERINSLIKKYFNNKENILLIGHSAIFALLLYQFKKVNNMEELFLERGGVAKFSQLKILELCKMFFI